MKPDTLSIRSLLLIVIAVLAGHALAQDVPPAQNPGDNFIKQFNNPVDRITLGYDLRMRETYMKNPFVLSNDSPANEWHFQRVRSRLWANMTPVQDIEIQARLVWEWRHYARPDSDDPFDRSGPIEWDEALFDRLHITISNVFGISDTKVTIGRQDILLGNGWLVRDGTPMDDVRTFFFDAVRLRHKLDADNTLDLIYIDQKGEAGNTIKPFNDQQRWGPIPGSLAEQDERGVIVYLTNSVWIPKADSSLYFIYKHDDEINYHGSEPQVDDITTSGAEADIFTLGARVDGIWDENWAYRAEFAQQTGRKAGQDICALGFNSRATYATLDRWNNQFRIGYEFLSGDRAGTDSTNEAFDPLWGRWPQWSELYIYTVSQEARLWEVTNLHRIGLGHTFTPLPKLEVSTDLHMLFSSQNTLAGTSGFSKDGHHRGELLTCLLTYQFNENITTNLIGEVFFPGDYYTDDRNDVASFLRYEMAITF